MSQQDDKMRAQRLRMALDLAESGIQMRLAQLRRNHPNEDESAIRRRLNEWLIERTDAGYEGNPWRHVEPSSLLGS